MDRHESFLSRLRAVTLLGVPLIGSNLASMALHVTDTIMVGWYGVAELAALVLGGSYYFILFILGAGFAQAIMPLVAASLGQGDETQVRRDTRMGLWLSLLYGVAVYPAMFWSSPILRALGQDEALSLIAQEFLRIAGIGVIPALAVMAMRSFLSSIGKAGVLLWVTLASVVLNGALAWALIFGHWGAPELGVRGAAIASLTTQSLTAFALMAYAGLHPDLRRFRLLSRFWRPDWPVLLQIWRLGLPIGLTSLFETGMFQAAALMMGWVGTVELASHGIALQLSGITFMLHLGLSNASTVLTGRAVGEGDMAGMRMAGLAAIAFSGAIVLVTVVIFLGFPEPLIGIYLDSTSPEAPKILAFASRLLVIAALFQLADAAQVLALGLLRGVQDTRVPMLIASVSYWAIGIPVSYLLAFPMGLGGIGVWIGLVVGLAIAAVLLMARFWLRWGNRAMVAEPSAR